MYASVDLVRKVSGMTDEATVASSIIRDKIMMGDGIINGALAYSYTLPMPYRRSCMVTFGGAGTGSGNMTVTVGGVAYTVAITSGLTASAAGDLLRVALADVENIFTDSYGSGPAVLIVSTDDSSSLASATAAVTVGAISTTNGVTGAVSVISDRYPPALQQFSANYAAALLISDNYTVIGEADQESTRDWIKRLSMMDKQLAQLQGVQEKGVPTLRILDEYTHLELSTDTYDEPSYLPNEVTDADETDPTSAKVRINSTF